MSPKVSVLSVASLVPDLFHSLLQAYHLVKYANSHVISVAVSGEALLKSDGIVRVTSTLRRHGGLGMYLAASGIFTKICIPVRA